MNALISAIFPRAKALILAPGPTWTIIAGEAHDLQRLMLSWVLPLAAIPPVAQFLGGLLFGRVPLGRGLSLAIGTYVFEIVMVLAIGWIAAWLAPRFGGENRPERGWAWIAYAFTPSWVAGVLWLIPAIGPLQILASLYGLYVAYLGVVPMLRVRPEQTVMFMVVLVVAGIVAGFALGVVLYTLGLAR